MVGEQRAMHNEGGAKIIGRYSLAICDRAQDVPIELNQLQPDFEKLRGCFGVAVLVTTVRRIKRAHRESR